MGDLVAAIIDRLYEDMKTAFSKVLHNFGEWKPLSETHLPYTAKNAYVSYEMYQRILAMEEGMCHHLDLNNWMHL